MGGALPGASCISTGSLSDLAAGVASQENILGCGATGRSRQAAKRKGLQPFRP
jgi:hypothetical protein